MPFGKKLNKLNSRGNESLDLVSCDSIMHLFHLASAHRNSNRKINPSEMNQLQINNQNINFFLFGSVLEKRLYYSK